MGAVFTPEITMTLSEKPTSDNHLMYMVLVSLMVRQWYGVSFDALLVRFSFHSYVMTSCQTYDLQFQNTI